MFGGKTMTLVQIPDPRYLPAQWRTDKGKRPKETPAAEPKTLAGRVILDQSRFFQ